MSYLCKIFFYIFTFQRHRNSRGTSECVQYRDRHIGHIQDCDKYNDRNGKNRCGRFAKRKCTKIYFIVKCKSS